MNPKNVNPPNVTSSQDPAMAAGAAGNNPGATDPQAANPVPAAPTPLSTGAGGSTAATAAGAAESPQAPPDSNPGKSGATGAGSGNAGNPKGANSNVQVRKEQYLIATKLVSGLQPMATDLLEQSLRNMPDVEILATLAPRGLAGVLSDGIAGPSRVIVARMPQDKAESLQRTRPPQVIVERDAPLRYSEPGPAPFLSTLDSAFMAPVSPPVSIILKVTGSNSAPVVNATVALIGNGFPAQGVSDGNGQVTLAYSGGTLDSIQALYIKPSSDYWTMYLPQPQLLASPQTNVVALTPLSQTFQNFPNQQVTGWGQKVMNLDQIPPTFKGRGTRIAIIDSGAATTHPDLQRINSGVDLTNNNNPASWSVDTVFHGSHCAGVIAGSGAVGIRGFAPEAEVHVCKIFPGGRFSDLISALDFCMEKGVDVVNLSLGSDQPSETLEQKILQAKQAGIACIVAAGNSGAAVQYPASSPNVLAVSAVGKLNEFPPNTYHSQTILGDSRLIGPDGFFAAKFSCFGPEVGVCGPGVAILSSVPNSNYAVWDGTSMAAPHITGLAALILAHHPDFQGQFQAKNSDRVNRLFEILKASARPLNLGDPNRTGAGLPDATRALPSAAGVRPQDSNQLFQALLGILQGRTPASAPAPLAAGSINDLRSAMISAGLAPAGQQEQTPASAATSPGGISPQSIGFGTTSGPAPQGSAAGQSGQVSGAANVWGSLGASPSQAAVPTQQDLSTLYLKQIERAMREAGLLVTA
jgi:subtilisin